MRVDLNSRLNYVNFRANKNSQPSNRRNVGEQQIVQSNNKNKDNKKTFVQPVVVLVPLNIQDIVTASEWGSDRNPAKNSSTGDDILTAPRRNSIWG